MKSDFNEVLCMKLAIEMLEMVQQVKKNRSQSLGDFLTPTLSNDAQYFIRSADLRKFLQSTQENCALYFALSVGQYYHEGAHVLSQIACLNNIRDGCEKWIQSGFSEFSKNSKDKIKKQWLVNLIVADSHQALNDYRDVELELDVFQCVNFVKNPELQKLEEKHLKNGERLEARYRAIFSSCNLTHEQNAEIKFQFAKSTIKWHELKQHYKEPQFVHMVNYLENSLKFGLKKILTAIRDQTKLPPAIMRKVNQGLFYNWHKMLKLNDATYVIVEIVMLYWKIFHINLHNAEFKKKFLLYPGPLDVMLGVGRNLLAIQFNDVVSSAPFTFLRMQNLAKLSEKTESDALLFAGLMTKSFQNSEPSTKLILQRESCISKAVEGKVNRSQMVLFSIKENFEQKEAKESRRQKRKADDFMGGNYAKFLENFELHSQKYSDVFRGIISCCSFQWSDLDPIDSIMRLFGLMNPKKENVDSPKLSRLNSFVTDVYCMNKLKEIKTTFLAPLRVKFFSTSSKTKKFVYLTQIACRLVQCAADAQVEFGCGEPPSKKSKVDTVNSVVETCQTFFSQKYPHTPDDETKEPICYQQFQSVMTFSIIQLCRAGVSRADLFRPECYPSIKPEVNYLSSQEPSQTSLPG